MGKVVVDDVAEAIVEVEDDSTWEIGRGKGGRSPNAVVRVLCNRRSWNSLEWGLRVDRNVKVSLQVRCN